MPHLGDHISDELTALDGLERDIRKPPKRNMSIVLPILVTLIVAAGASSIAWYSYTTGVREGSEGAAPLLKPSGPLKVTPKSPGGLSIPHQDKTVFQAIEGRRTDTRIERLLPPPETPVSLPKKLAAPGTAEPSKVRHSERLETPSAEREVTSGPTRLTPGAGRRSPPPPSTVETRPAPMPAPKESAKAPPSVSMPVQAQPKPGAMTKPAAAKKAPVVARVPPTATPETTPRSGFGVQIASLSSKARAHDFWNAHKRKHNDLLGALSLVVRTATVKGKTYHRVQGGTLKSRTAAGKLCGALKKRGVGCVIVSFGK